MQPAREQEESEYERGISLPDIVADERVAEGVAPASFVAENGSASIINGSPTRIRHAIAAVGYRAGWNARP